jgi:predicted HTH domain antitoxin
MILFMIVIFPESVVTFLQAAAIAAAAMDDFAKELDESWGDE